VTVWPPDGLRVVVLVVVVVVVVVVDALFDG
jgi:hypothetical protein